MTVEKLSEKLKKDGIGNEAVGQYIYIDKTTTLDPSQLNETEYSDILRFISNYSTLASGFEIMAELTDVNAGHMSVDEIRIIVEIFNPYLVDFKLLKTGLKNTMEHFDTYSPNID